MMKLFWKDLTIRSNGCWIGYYRENGGGKTTFWICGGWSHPDSGKVNIGETVVFGYYSQTRPFIKEDLRVIEYVKNMAEHFRWPAADRWRRNSGLFLFPPDKQYTISQLVVGKREGCSFWPFYSGIRIFWSWMNQQTTWICPHWLSSKISCSISRDAS